MILGNKSCNEISKYNKYIIFLAHVHPRTIKVILLVLKLYILNSMSPRFSP